MIKVRELKNLLEQLDDSLDIQISVDVSTGEEDAFNRVFLEELLETQDGDTILFKGSTNF